MVHESHRSISVGDCSVYLMHGSHIILADGEFCVYIMQGYHRDLGCRDILCV